MTERKWRAKSGWCLIAKNEEKDLPRCLASMRGCWDEGCLVVVDTGSTDRTVEIAKEFGAIVEHFTWIQDFGKARQFALEKLYEHCPDIDYWSWCDCDDVLLSQNDVIRFRELLDEYLDNPNIMGLNMKYVYSHESTGTGEIPSFDYHRLRTCKKGFGKWVCRIHEYIQSDQRYHVNLHDVVFHHYRDHGKGTQNTKRNLEILKLVVDEASPEERPRYLFYYGKEATYNGLWDVAVAAFEEYIPLSNWLPEKHRAMFELAYCYKWKGNLEKAYEYAFKAITLNPNYCDPYIFLCQDCYERQDYKMSIAWADMIPNLTKPDTLFFSYIPNNTYVGPDYQQAAYYYLGQPEKAKEALDKCLFYKPHDRRYLKNWTIFRPEIPKVGIIIPTLNRKEQLINCISKIKENAITDNYEIFIGVDGNEQYFNELNTHFKDETNMNIVLFEEKSGVPTIVERLVDIAKEHNCGYVSYLGDDTEPLVGFLVHAIMVSDGKYLVSYNDKVWKEKGCCHWLAPIDLRDKLGGFFFYNGYIHIGCDNELQEKAEKLGLYKFAEKAYVDHIHYIKNICSNKDRVAEFDECYKQAWCDETVQHDRDLLERRRKNNFISDNEEIKINIGAGSTKYEGYLTLDKYCNADIKKDIFEIDLFNDGTVDKFLAEHVLEHFSSADGEKFMKICYNSLKVGGELEISVPDLGRLNEITDEEYKLKVLYGHRDWGEGMFHLFGYSEKTLKELFVKFGFEIKEIKSLWCYDAPEIRIIGIKK